MLHIENYIVIVPETGKTLRKNRRINTQIATWAYVISQFRINADREGRAD